MKTSYACISAKAKLLKKDSRGAAAIIFALVVPVLLIAVGGAINLNSVQNHQANLDAAVNAATINAATMYESMQSDLETPSNEFFLANLGDNLKQQLLPNGNGFISMKSRFNQDGKLEVEGFAEAKIKLSFTSFLGMDDYTISRRTVAVRTTSQKLELSTLIDSTASMCAFTASDADKMGVDPQSVTYPVSADVTSAINQVKNLSLSGGPLPGSSTSSGGKSLSGSSSSGGITTTSGGIANSSLNLQSPMQYIPDPNCTKLEAAKAAAKHLVDKIHANVQFKGEPLISVVPFNFKVDAQELPSSIKGSEPSDFYTDLSDAQPLSPIVPYTKDKNTARDGIDAITSDFNGAGWTRLTLPLQVAGEQFHPANQAIFGGEEPFGWDEDVTRIIVLLSDGGNVGAAFSNLNFDFSKYHLYLYKTDMLYQKKVCEDIKKPVKQGGAGAIIFTVLLGMDAGDFQDNASLNLTTSEQDGFAWVEDTMKGCASFTQGYFHVPVNEQVPGELEDTLVKIYDQIAQFTYIATIVQTDSHSTASDIGTFTDN